MPLYEYKCDDDHGYLENRSIKEDQKVTECPVNGCGKTLKRIFEATPTIFTGSGFYKTDSKK